jgi:uncharacterized protein
MAFLPWLMSSITAVVILTVYAFVFLAMLVLQLRRDIHAAAIADLLAGTALGIPIGVWALAALPASALNRVLGVVLLAVVALEMRGRLGARLQGRGWALAAGFVAGITGGAVGTPGPPVVVYAASQDWNARALKANVSAFLLVNQAVTLAAYWWIGLVTREVLVLSAGYAAPGLAGACAGMLLFGRISVTRFRQVVFALLFVSGALLLVGG